MTETTDRTPPPEVLEELRDFLAEAMRTQAAMCAHTSIHLEELGDTDGAQGEMGCALLGAWLAENVSAWTHATRLREGLAKFDPMTAGVALAELVANDIEVDVTDGPQ